MGFPCLAAALFLAAAWAAPAAWGQDEAGELKKQLNLVKEGGEKELVDEGPLEKLIPEKRLAEKKKAKPKAKKEGALGPEEPEEPDEPAAAPVPGGKRSPRASAPTAERAAASREAAGGRRERTMSRAAGAAEAMRRSLRTAEDPAGFAATPANEARNDSPKENRNVPEMALAARSGYAETFRARGLKVGSGPRGEPAIQRADGTPASAAELESLGAALRAEPEALVRRPDFYSVLPREKFADLKGDFQRRPELRSTVFKHMGMTEGARDFRWFSSCSSLSGDCNPVARGASYRKGAEVPPETLSNAWEAAHEEQGEAEEEFGEYTDEDRRLAAAEDLAAEKFGAASARAPSLASLLARMGELAGGLVGESGSVAGREPSASSGGATVVAGEAGTGPRPASAPARARTAPPEGNRPPAPEGRRAAQGRGWLYGLAGAALVLAALRRKQVLQS